MYLGVAAAVFEAGWLPTASVADATNPQGVHKALCNAQFAMAHILFGWSPRVRLSPREGSKRNRRMVDLPAAP